jgi:hypothetical protein
MPVINMQVRSREFLKEMYADGYFPKHLVDKETLILLALCERIEEQDPEDEKALYVLTHSAA